MTLKKSLVKTFASFKIYVLPVIVIRQVHRKCFDGLQMQH